MSPRKKTPSKKQEVAPYEHKDATAAMRPDVGTQAHFRKKKPPQTYRYDSSLGPELQWDANPAREEGEALIAQIEKADKLEDAKAAASKLKAMSRPFFNWTGKAERPSFDVPTLPLFVHERLSTKAILESLKGRPSEGGYQMDIFGDPQHTVTDQVLKAYEHRDRWVNRMILGDSLVTMNSLLHYESMGGQVQMIYIDPPYGVKFGSNFQPFVRKRDVGNNDDEEMTREPEMVQAYRDTWELGLHSYLSYLRDRLFLAHDLLAPSGSIFVQINDQNVHHVRELLDDVFGPENFISQVNFQTTSGFTTKTIATLGDYLLWYARDFNQVKVKKLFRQKIIVPGEGNATWVLLPDGSYRGVTAEEKRGETLIPKEAKLYKPDNIVSQGAGSESQPFTFQGKVYNPPANSHWKANYPQGMQRLADAGRIHVASNSIQYRRFSSDFPYEEIGNFWTDTQTGNFTADKVYAVQTNVKVIERCILLTTDPGDLIIDPTCGSGTTAYVAEQWGRRWITIDTSRVPIALARQRLLTSTFDWYELKDVERGPGGGFVYQRKQNKKGEEVGGIVPHTMLENIANNETPQEEVMVDRPEVTKDIVRITGPFTVEATIPTPANWEEGTEANGVPTEDIDERMKYTDRMIEVLRRSPIIRMTGNKAATFKNVRPIARSLALAAEAMQENGEEKPVAFAFGPENGAVSESLVFEAVKEANARGYKHLFVIGFAIQPNAQNTIDKSADAFGIGATYVPATMDLVMSDLLKTTRSSQVFSVCGKPEVAVVSKQSAEGTRFQVELKGLDLFDPVTMETDPRPGDDVPMWMLDTDYNGLSFRACQVFFPRTGAWDAIKKALKAEFEPGTFEHLAGTVSAPFHAGENRKIAVKVIDDRGNELLAVQDLPAGT